jgi:hypothetical protein
VIGATHVRMFGRVTPATFLALREFGRPAARLPAPALPRALLRRLHRTERAYASAGSIGGAARALGIPSQQVRRRLELARAVHALPSVSAAACKRR